MRIAMIGAGDQGRYDSDALVASDVRPHLLRSRTRVNIAVNDRRVRRAGLAASGGNYEERWLFSTGVGWPHFPRTGGTVHGRKASVARPRFTTRPSLGLRPARLPPGSDR